MSSWLVLSTALVWTAHRALHATSYYWDTDGSATGDTVGGTNLGGAGTWDLATSKWWDGSSLTLGQWPNLLSPPDRAIFSGTAGMVTLGAAITAGGLRFDVDGYTIAGGGNVLTLGGGAPTVSVTNAATQATITADVLLGANATFGGAGNLVFNTGVISGAGYGFTEIGSGTLTLGGANTFSGPVAVRGGVLSITAANNLGDGSGGNSLTLGGGTLRVSGTFNLGVSRALVIGLGDGVIEVTGSNNLTVDSALSTAPGTSGGVILTKTGTGTLTLSGTNNAAAIAATVNAGTLSISSNNNLGTGRITLNGGTLQATGTISMANGISLGTAGGTIEVTGANVLTAATLAVIGPGSLTKTGTGTLQLNVASTYAGSTTVTLGTLQGGVASFLAPRTQLTVSAGATLNLNNFATTVATLSGAGIITNTSGAVTALTLGNALGSVDTTFSGSFNASTPANLTLTKTSGGTLTIISTTPGTATGAWTLNAGTVLLDYSAIAGSGNILTSRAMTLTGGTLQIKGRNGATVTQGLGTITIGVRGGQIIMTPNGGTSTTLALGALAHVTTAGASLLINAPATTKVTTSTTTLASGIFGGRYVFTDGTSFDWATNGGTAANAIAGLGTYAALYSALDPTAGTDNNNSTLTGSGALSGGRTTNTLKLSTSAGGQTLDLAGNTLTLTAGGLLFTGANDYTVTGGTLASNTVTPSDLIVHQYGAGVLTINSIIGNGAGASTLTKAGSGTLVLGGVNTFTGAVFINGGALSISNNNQLGATLTTAITINDGGGLKTTADVNTGTHTFSLTGGNATYDVANGTTLTVGGVISGAGGLSITNTGTVVLGAANTYTGPTFVGAGATLKGGATTFINSTSGGTLTVAAGGTVDMLNFTLNVGGIAGSGTITNSGGTAVTLSLGSTTNTTSTNQDSTFSGTLSGALNIGKNGGGSLTLTSPATYTGSTTVSNGGIIFGVTNALPIGTLTLGNNAGPVTAFVDLHGFNWTSGAITFYGTSGGVTSQAYLNIGDGDVLTLGGTVTFTNNTTAANSALPAYIYGGTIDLSATRSFAIADSPNAAADLTVTSVISSTGGAFGITKTGAGTLVLTGANTYTGTTTINGASGVLALAGAGTLGAGANALTVTNGILDLYGTNQTVGAFTGAATGTVRNSAGGTLSTLTFGDATSGTFAGTLSDGGGSLALVKNGSGTTTLSGTNTYSGGTQVNAGILDFANTSAQPSSGTTQVASTAALGLGVGSAGFYSATDVDNLFLNTLTNVNLAAGAAVAVDTSAGDFTYAMSPSLVTSRGLIKLGANVLVLTLPNTFTGGVTSVAGEVSIGDDSQLGAVSSPFTFNGGGLRITGTSDTAWNVSRTINFTGAAIVDITDATNTYTIGSNASLGGTLTKIGLGTLNFSQTLDNTGQKNIAVQAGTFKITNDITNGGTAGALLIGNVAGNSAAVVQTGGAVALGTVDGTGLNLVLANAANSFGAYTISGGTLQTTRSDLSTGTNSIAIMNVLNGGTVNGTNYMIGGRSTNSLSAFNIAGGTYNITPAAVDRTGQWGSLSGRTDVNIGVDLGGLNKGGILDLGSSATAVYSLIGSTGGSTILSLLNGGTLRVLQLHNSVVPGTNPTTSQPNFAYVNFNGGTLKYSGSVAAPNFFTPTNVTGAYVNAGGAIIDDNGQAITVSTPLLTPTGSGVSSIPISDGGSGYLTAPYVQITDATGTGAAAVAVVDANGKVTSIVITNPGIGYSATPTVTLVGGLNGGATVGATLGAAVASINTSGGLTKVGAGTLTLTGTNTFTGATVVNGGTLSIAPTALPSTSSLWVGKTGSATFDLNQDGVGAAWNMAANANVILGSATTSGALGFQLGTASDSIVLSGTGGLTINAGGGFINGSAISGFGVGPYIVITGAASITGGGSLQLGSLPSGYSYSLSTGSSTVTITVLGVAAAGDLYWRGDVNGSWTQAGTNTNWSTQADGSSDPGYTPGPTNDVWFSATNASAFPILTTLDNAVSVLGLKFINSGTGAVTIAAGSGGSLTIGADGIEVRSGAPATTTISAPIILGTAQTWSVAQSDRTLSVSGVVSGGLANSTQASPGVNVSLTITGAGSVAMIGTANTFTGDIVVNGATLNVSNLTDWGGPTVASSTSHTITLTNGAKLAATASVNPGATTTTSYDLVQIGTGGATIDTASGVTMTLDDAGQFFGSGDLTKTGLGTLFVSNTQTYSGANVYVNNGILRLGASAGLGAGAKTLYLGDTTGSNSATLQIGTASSLTLAATTQVIVRGGSSGTKTLAATNTSSTNTISGTIILNDDVTVDEVSGGTFSLAGGFNDGGVARTITKTGAGTLSIGASQSLVDGTAVNISVGRLNTGSANSLRSFANVTVASGAIFGPTVSQTVGALNGAGTVTATAGITLTVGSTNNLSSSFSGAFSASTAALVKAGSGTLTLSGQNLYTGSTTVNNGTLTVDFNAASISTNIISGSSALVLGGGTLNVLGDAVAPASQTFASSTMTAASYSAVTADGAVGGLTLNLGTLTRNFNAGLNLNLTNSPLITLAGVSTANGLAVGSTGAAFLTINATDWGTISGGSPIAVLSYQNDDFSGSTNNVNVTISGAWSGTTVNTVRFNTGTPTLTLSGSNALAAGGLLVGSGAGAVTASGAGTLAGSAAAGTVASPVVGELGIFQHSASPLTISTAIVNNASGLSYATATPTGTALNKYGNGTLVLSSTNNAYTAGTNISNGTLRLGASEVLPDGAAQPGAVTIAASATLDLNGFAETINGLAGGGTVNNSSATPVTLFEGNTNATSSFSGVLKNTGVAGGFALTKIGTGTLTLSGANTYDGATTINLGGITLDFTVVGAPLSNIINSASALKLGSATLTVNGSTIANSQTFNGTTFSGGGRVTLSGTTPALTVNLGAITRAAGTGATINVTLVSPGVVTTSNSNDTTGILGSWAVVNSADFATVSAGNIVAYSGYTAVAGVTGAGDPTQNALFNTSNSVSAATVDYNTIKIGTAAPSFAAGTNILRLGAVGAILMPTGTAATSIGSAAGNGILTAGGAANTAGELDLINWSSNALTINSAINNNGTGVVTVVKSGSGGVTLAATTNAFTGSLIINQGTVTSSLAAQVPGAVTLNGGALTFTADAGLTTMALTLGAGGGTLTLSGIVNGDRTFGTTGNIGTTGVGPRTLTVVPTGANRRVIFQSNLIDGSGGPTSLVLSAGGDTTNLRLSGTNTFTGTITITRGDLDFTATTAIPGGITSAATVGNIIFSGANRSILQSSVATPTDFTRSLGYGDGQVHWEGNGGFSNNVANSVWNINLGGAGAQLVWGLGGFVPTGSTLQFGVASVTNSVTNLGAVDFKNAIDLGNQVRTIESASANDKVGSTPYDAILSGNLTGTTGGGINKTGAGVMILKGVNNTAPLTVNVAAGGMAFSGASAIPGSGQNITLGANTFIGLAGSTDPISDLGGRIANPTINAAFGLGADSSVNFDFTAYPNMRLAAYAVMLPLKAITYTGTITPANATYMLGGTPFASDPANTLATTLVMKGINQLTGANALNVSYGNVVLLDKNDFTGGTTLDGNAVGSADLSIGSNAALGFGNLSLTGNQTKTLAAVGGDRLLANNILWGGSATSFVAAGDATNDGALNTTNGGGISYVGTITISDTATAPTILSRTSHQVLLLGNVNNGILTSGLTYSDTTTGLISSLATAVNGGVAKTYNGTSIINATMTLVIDSDSSLGNGGTISLGGGGTTGNTATLQVQPGSGSITLVASRSIALTADRTFEVRVGAADFLTLAGILAAQGTNTAARNFSKTDTGTLVFTNKNNYTGAATFSPGLAIRGGKVQLDSSSGNFTSATDRFFPDATNPLPLAFSAATGTFAGGGTLEIIQASSNAFTLTQGFGAVTFNTGANVVKLTNNSVTQGLVLNLGSFTRTALLGGIVDFQTSTAGGAVTIGSAVANNTAGIIGGYATFNGLDWATQSGGFIVAYNSYIPGLPASGSSSTTNYLVTTSPSAVTTSETIGSLKFAPTGGTQTITINTGVIISNTSAGVLFDNTNGPGIITTSGTGQIGAAGTEVEVTTNGTGDITTNKLTLSGVLRGTSTAVSKSGSGTLVLAGANTYTGALIINAGVVEYGNGSATGQNLGSPTAGAGNIILNGGTLRQTATSNLIFGMTVNGYSKLDVPNGVTLSQTAQGITGKAGVTGILQKTGAGTLTFSGSTDNPSLSLEVVGGTANLGKNSSATVHSVGVSSGSTAATNMGAALIIDGGATVNITGSGGDQIHDQSSIVVALNGLLNLGGGIATAESFDGLAGAGSVTNTGLAGTFTLTLGAGNDVNISAYSLAAASAGVNATGLNSFSGIISDGSATDLVALTKTGSGTQILSGQNTYSGATTINAGTLELGVANALPSGANKGDVNIVGNGYGAATINGGTSIGAADKVTSAGTLDMGGFDQAINGLNSSTGGYVVNNPTLSWNGSAWVAAASTNTLTLGNGNASASFNGVILNGYTVVPGAVTAQAVVGTLAVTKVGTGVQTLAGNNTYTGATAVTQGEVVVSGTLSGTAAVSVTTGATVTLTGSGSINNAATVTVNGLLRGSGTVGQVNVATGGEVSPGTAGTGILNTGAFNLLDSTSKLSIEVNLPTAVTPVAGTHYDQVNVNGNSQLNGDLAFTIDSATGVVGNDILFIAINSGGADVVGSFATMNGASFDPAGFTVGGQLWAISYNANWTGSYATSSFSGGNDVAIMAIPEPGSLSMLAGSFGLALGVPRFRRRGSLRRPSA